MIPESKLQPPTPWVGISERRSSAKVSNSEVVRTALLNRVRRRGGGGKNTFDRLNGKILEIIL